MNWTRLQIVSLVMFCGGGAFAGSILVVAPVPGKSHVMLFESLIEALANRGHRVTFLTGLTPKITHENIEALVVPPPKPSPNRSPPNFFEFRHASVAKNVIMTPKSNLHLLKNTMESEQFHRLMNEDRHYDVVIVQAILSECIAAGLTHKFHAPLIGFGTFMPSYWVNYMVGNEAPSSYIPDPFTSLPTRMTFLERMYSLVFNVAANSYHQWSHIGTHDQLMREYFGQDLPYIGDIIRNTSILLVNDHYSVSFPRPAVPNVINVGGLHVKPPKPLPAELQKYLDKSTYGAILFSLGSNLQSSKMGPEKIQLFLNVFAKVKQNVLWKFETDLPNKPENVITSEWLPQSDILAHPNLKLFITHGGLLSTTEAVDRGVPIVGIPIFGDQPMNMKQSVNAGVGLSLDYDSLTEDMLLEAINQVLTQPKYTAAAKARSQAMKDVMVQPLDAASWWVEYVIRNKGAPHLRSVGQDLTWYQRENIDVIATLAIIVLLIVKLNICFAKWMVRKLCESKTLTNTKKKRQ